MRKVNKVIYLMTFGVVILACQKKDINKNIEHSTDPKSLIHAAKLYFEREIIGRFYQNQINAFSKVMLKKPLWEKAFISKKSIAEFVVIPLSYEKAINLASAIAPNITFSAESQTKLVMYKDEKGKSQAHIYTFIPDTEHLNGKNSRFSGIISKENWEGTEVKNLLFKNGKYKVLRSQNLRGAKLQRHLRKLATI